MPCDRDHYIAGRYHRNYYVNSTFNYYNNTMWQQGVDPATAPDPFLNRTFGASIFGGSGISKVNSTSIAGDY